MKDVLKDDCARWYAMRVKSGSEQLVASMARNKGYEEFVPLYDCRRRWSDRFKTVRVPLFPGYVFCRLNADRRLPLLTIPGVLHFVSFGRTPAALDDAEIEAIQTATASGLSTEPWPFPEVGQQVRIEYGPLAGLEGVLLEVHKQQRIVVSISLLKRSVAVEVERDWVSSTDSVTAGGQISIPFQPTSGRSGAQETYSQ